MSTDDELEGCDVGELAEPVPDEHLPYEALLARALNPYNRTNRATDVAALARQYRELFGGTDA
jgi:hypothetical protein